MKQKAEEFWFGTNNLISIFTMLFPIVLIAACSSFAVTGTPPSPEATKATTNTLEPTQTPSMTPMPSPNPTVTPTPLGGAGVVLLDLRPDTYDDCLGIFALDIVTGESTRVTDEGYALEAVSPDGDKFLVSQSENLVLARLNESDFFTIAQNFTGDPNLTRAYWLPGTDTIVFAGQEQGQDYVYSVREDGTDLQKITQHGAKLYGLANTHSSHSIMWQAFDADTMHVYWYRSNLDGSNPESLKKIMSPAYSPIGDKLAYMDNQNGYYIAISDFSDEVQLDIPIEFGPHIHIDLPSLQWIRGGENLLVYIFVTDAGGYPVEFHHHYYIFSASGVFEGEANIPFMMSELQLVFPDGLQMIFATWVQDGNRFYPTHDLYLLDLITFKVTPLELDLPEDQVIASMMWLQKDREDTVRLDIKHR